MNVYSKIKVKKSTFLKMLSLKDGKLDKIILDKFSKRKFLKLQGKIQIYEYLYSDFNLNIVLNDVKVYDIYNIVVIYKCSKTEKFFNIFKTKFTVYDENIVGFIIYYEDQGYY